MPTRFTLNGSGKPIFEELRQAYLRDEIAPTAFIPAICEYGELKLLRWGLTPSWAKEDFGASLLHARREKAFDQNSFKTPLARRRCIIPATAFFEWRDEFNSMGVDPLDPAYLGLTERVKYRFTVPSQPLFYFAGVWDDWIDPNGSEIASCAIMTTYPNSMVIRFKPQMPCILRTKDIDTWMNHEVTDRLMLDSVLRGLEADELKVERV